MRIITTDDFVETYAKGVQRGFGFLASKFRISKTDRTLSAFDDSTANASNWWMIPGVRRRWNKRITGEENTIYEDYVVQKYLREGRDLRMLSLGFGTCSHEIRFAAYPVFSMIRCVDMAGNLLEKARQKSLQLGLENMAFLRCDVHGFEPEQGYYDVILFHASLNHFRDIAHHFMEETPESAKILQQLFELEDEYLRHAKSDFVFAVYRKNM